LKDRLVTLMLAVGAFALFYVFFVPKPPDPQSVALPLSTESGDDGYQAIWRWLRAQNIPVSALHEPYTRLSAEPALFPSRGNVLITTLPHHLPARVAELGDLDAWIGRGNTLVVMAALDDTPRWAVVPNSGFLRTLGRMTRLKFEAAPQEADHPGAAPERNDAAPDSTSTSAKRKNATSASPGASKREWAMKAVQRLLEPQRFTITPSSHPLFDGVHSILATSEFPASRWSADPMDASPALEIGHRGSATVEAKGAEGEGKGDEGATTGAEGATTGAEGATKGAEGGTTGAEGGTKGEGGGKGAEGRAESGAKSAEPAVWLKSWGDGQILVFAFASPFSNGAIAEKDNARLLSNIVARSRDRTGAVIFDDDHQGAVSYTDAKAFFHDPRLHRTLLWILVLWLLFVLGTQRMRPGMDVWNPADITTFIGVTGGFFASVLTPAAAGSQLFKNFFNTVRRNLDLREDGTPVWEWFATNARVEASSLAELQRLYARTQTGKSIDLVRLHNILSRLTGTLA